MTFNGIEEEVPAAVPVALYADTDIFAKAPAGLNAVFEVGFIAIGTFNGACFLVASK